MNTLKSQSKVAVSLLATCVSLASLSPAAMAQSWIGLGVSLGSNIAYHTARRARQQQLQQQQQQNYYYQNGAPMNWQDANVYTQPNSRFAVDPSTGAYTTRNAPAPAVDQDSDSSTTNNVDADDSTAKTRISRPKSQTAFAPNPGRPADQQGEEPSDEKTYVPQYSETGRVRYLSGRAQTSMENKAIELYNHGVDRANAQKFDEAADLFNKALSIDPDMSEAHGGLGMALDQLKNYAGARYEIAQGMKRSGFTPSLWYYAADINVHYGDYPEAARAYKNYIAQGTDASCVEDSKRALSIIKHDFLGTPDGDYLADATEEGRSRWADTTMPLKVFIDDSQNVKGFQPEFARSLRQAFQNWSDISDGKITFAFTNDRAEANITCAWTSDVTKFGDTQELGLTHVSYDRASGAIHSATIDLYTLADRANQPAEQVLRTAKAVELHEIGHALGLGHSHAAYDIMYPLTSPEGLEFPLTARDKNTITALYSEPVQDIASARGTTTRKHSVLH